MMTDQEIPAPEFPTEDVPAASTVQGGRGLVGIEVEEPDTESWRADLVGLLTMGELHASFSWCGHSIRIRTLSTREELLVAELVKAFEGGMGGMKAYATATAGLCVQSIDGEDMPVPLGEDPARPNRWAIQRFNYAQRWYPPTVDAIFDGYLQLEARQREVMDGLGKASGPEVLVTPGSSASSGSPAIAVS